MSYLVFCLHNYTKTRGTGRKIYRGPNLNTTIPSEPLMPTKLLNDPFRHTFYQTQPAEEST